MKDERGAVVLARLESATLQELARKTGGQYRDASEWVNLPGLLKATVEAGRKGRFIEKNTIRYAERFQWALAPAVLCLLMSFWLEFPVRPRPRSVALKGATPLVAAALCAVVLIVIPPAARAATAEQTASTTALPQGDLLGRIVGRLSAADAPNALDWAELGRQTITWGQHMQSDQQPVTPGPLRDALEAVDRGRTLDPKAADWPRLRSDLEALLRKPPEQQQQQPKQQNQNQNQSEQQKSEQQKEERKDRQQSRQNQPREETGRPRQEQAQPSPEKRSEETQAPRAGSQGTQQVGGTRLKTNDPAATRPELAVPIQKLEQVRNQDSPAELYQMIENNEPRPPAKTGKDW